MIRNFLLFVVCLLFLGGTLLMEGIFCNLVTVAMLALTSFGLAIFLDVPVVLVFALCILATLQINKHLEQLWIITWIAYEGFLSGKSSREVANTIQCQFKQ